MPTAPTKTWGTQRVPTFSPSPGTKVPRSVREELEAPWYKLLKTSYPPHQWGSLHIGPRHTALLKTLHGTRGIIGRTLGPLRLHGCSSDNPCGTRVCPFCAQSMAIKVATLLGTLGFGEPKALGFTLVAEDIPETTFHRAVRTKDWTGHHNACDPRGMNHRWATALCKHLSGPTVLFPDVEWQPENRCFSLHYHGLTLDPAGLRKLREHRAVPYCSPVKNLWRYVQYSHKIPVVRHKHLDAVDHRDPQVVQRRALANHSLLLWTLADPVVLYLNLGKQMTGQLRSRVDLPVPFAWRASHSS